MFTSELVAGSKILVVAAHPDDEVLGCGGTIAKASSMGAQVNVLFFTNGTGARVDSSGPEAALRKQMALDSLKILGVSGWKFLDFPDNQLDTVSLLEIIKAVEVVVSEFEPAIVLTHNVGDLNIDHRIVSEAVSVACRPPVFPFIRAILHFEVPSSTEWSVNNGVSFVPGLFVDIDNELQAKVDALKCYNVEIRDFPHSRSVLAIESLARWRGACSALGAAEAFLVHRMLIK